MLRKKKVDTSKNDDFFGDGNDDASFEHEPMPDYAPVKQKTPRSRVLLLLLLLLAVAGGGYFYLLGPKETPLPPPAPAPVPVRRPIPVQPPAAAPATVENKGVVPAAPNAPPTAQSPVPPVTPVIPPVSTKPAATAMPAQPAAPKPAPPAVAPAPVAAPAPTKAASEGKQASSQAAVAPAVKETPAPAAVKTAPAAAPAEKTEPAAVSKTAPVAGKYTIEAGAFLVKANRQAAEKIIARLGFKSKITTIRRPVKMIRLRVGGPYTPMAAELKLAELAAFTPDAFSVPTGDQLIVYAGSYFLIDEARILADKLYMEGIRVEEEKAQVTMPLDVVTFGSFPSKDAAAKTLAKAKSAGLKPIVIRK